MQKAEFRPIRADRLSDQAVRQLAQMIRSGRLPVGARLPSETQLSQMLGVSRGILREALTVLQANGYISRTPREGTIVTSATGNVPVGELSKCMRRARYEELMEFREAIECRVAQDVILKAGDEEILGLRELIQTPRDGGVQDSVDYYFHYQLAELSGNSLFPALLDTYYDLIHEMTLVSHRNSRRLAQQQKEHLRIVDALEKRSVRAAVNAVKAHLSNVLQAVVSAEGEEGAP